MEDRALEILRLILSRRKMETKTDRVVTDEIDRVNLYTIGNVLVIFSQKDKGLLDRDINTMLKFADTNGYKNGIIIVAMSPPSENVERFVKTLTKERIQFFHIQELQSDIMQHKRYAMPHRILNEDERTKVINEFKIQNPETQLPSIDCQDIMARLIGAVPGDIIEVTRHSEVAGTALYYRYCVEDVNVA
jgi:DNA-directed RNA polymerase subunit H